MSEKPEFSDMYQVPKRAKTNLAREIRKREFSYVDRQVHNLQNLKNKKVF